MVGKSPRRSAEQGKQSWIDGHFQIHLCRECDRPAANSGSAFASAPGIGWGYNARGEVVSVAHSDSTQSRFYGVDAMGNRTISRKGVSIDSGGARTSYVANSLNQYSAIGSTNPTYDLDGNQLVGPLLEARSVANKWVKAKSLHFDPDFEHLAEKTQS